MFKRKDSDEITQQNVMNTKITSSKIYEQKKKFSNRACRKPQCRIIGLMEMMAYVLKYPMVYTNVEFVHVPTVPLEQRGAIEDGVTVDVDAFATVNDLCQMGLLRGISVRRQLGMPLD